MGEAQQPVVLRTSQCNIHKTSHEVTSLIREFVVKLRDIAVPESLPFENQLAELLICIL